MNRPDSEDFLVLDDTWHGISVVIIDGGDGADGFDSVEAAAAWALDEMDRLKFWPNLWVQHDQGDPYLMDLHDANDVRFGPLRAPRRSPP